MMTATMSALDPYFLGYSEDEQVRLERQASEFEADSQWLFDRVAIASGMHVLEMGCGPRGCLELLSRRVAPTGRVVGVERNTEEVARARRFVAEQGLANVEVVQADARATGLAGAAFDVATARLVLVNVPRPEQIVAEMVRLVRPGGVVALHEADCIGHQMCDPPLPAWDRLFDLLNRYAERHGIDRFVGRKIPRLLRQMGLRDVQVRPLLHAYPPGHERRKVLLDFVHNVRARLLGANLVDAAELDALMAAFARHLDDDETEVYSAVLVQAWGRA
jgi:SAM-dependent methyltransferase